MRAGNPLLESQKQFIENKCPIVTSAHWLESGRKDNHLCWFGDPFSWDSHCSCQQHWWLNTRTGLFTSKLVSVHGHVCEWLYVYTFWKDLSCASVIRSHGKNTGAYNVRKYEIISKSGKKHFSFSEMPFMYYGNVLVPCPICPLLSGET